jgi:hypothetical protein
MSGQHFKTLILKFKDAANGKSHQQNFGAVAELYIQRGSARMIGGNPS